LDENINNNIMENANYSGIPPMPEEFYNHNRGRCPHKSPNRLNFFGNEHRATYEAWDDGEIDPKDPALLIQFEAWNRAWKDWSKAHDDWREMDLARCHGKWIALVQLWAEYYRNLEGYPFDNYLGMQDFASPKTSTP
jgi:hypothetical protein